MLFNDSPADRLPKTYLVLLATLAIVLSLITYGRTLFLPFLFDDLVQLPFVGRYTLGQHWSGSNESPYYRPLVISIWKIAAFLTNGHSAPLHHALNLLFHALNGFLTALLAFRLCRPAKPQPEQPNRQITFSAVALTLFLLFPFHYQAIPWPGALFHLVVTSLILGTLLAYLNGWLITALIVAFIAPFAHENGVVLPALILLLELMCFWPKKKEWQRLILRPLIMSTPAILWLLVRSFVNSNRESDALLPGFESVFQSLTYFFQGLTWPATIFGRSLVGQIGLNDISVVWLLGGFALILAGMISRKSLALLIFGGGWWLASSAPAMLALPFGYIVNSPRLLSLAGVGVAIFWSAVIMSLIDAVSEGRKKPLGAAVGALLLLIFFASGQMLAVAKIQESNRYHTMLGGAYQRATTLSAALDQLEQYPVFINFPSSIAPAENRFPLGNEGIVFWPSYAPQHTIVTTNGDVSKIDQQFVQVDGIRTEQPYFYGIVGSTGPLADFGKDQNAVFYNTVYSADSIQLLPAGGLTAGPSADGFGRFVPDSNSYQIQLLGSKSSLVDNYVQIEIDWRVESGSAENVTVFLHAVNGAGELIAQSDGDPLMGLIPLSALAAGESLLDIRHVPADPAIAAFRLGLYDRITGERIPFYDADGWRAADDMFVFDVIP